MNVLCTFPGRHGDIIWALPTVRAISEAFQVPVDLGIAPKYAALRELIHLQPYIRTCFPVEDWQVEETAPMTPRAPLLVPGRVNGEKVDLLDPIVGVYDRIFHLGYTGWPMCPLPYEVERLCRLQFRHPDAPLIEIDLTRPWITTSSKLPPTGDIAVGFTDEWFELKVGIWHLLNRRIFRHGVQFWPVTLTSVCNGPRWSGEAGHSSVGLPFLQAAEQIAGARVFLGCCSALHVLAVALGKPVVCVEPNPHRHNDVFYPLGKTDRVRLVLGTDGQPTFDARHVAEAIEVALS